VFDLEVGGAPGSRGEDGQDGDPGQSAYEVAVQNGFSGTESEWLASLKGDPGDPGSSTLAGLTDVALDGTPADGQVATWADGKLTNTDPTDGGLDETAVRALIDASDPGDPLLRAAADPVTANMVRLGPAWAVSAATLPLAAETIPALGNLANTDGPGAAWAERALGFGGLPSIVPGDPVAPVGIMPGSDPAKRGRAVAPVPPGMWSGLHLVGELDSDPTSGPWVTDTLKIEWRLQKHPMSGGAPGAYPGDDGQVSYYHEFVICRNNGADPAYSMPEFGVLRCGGRAGGGQNNRPNMRPGRYLYLDYADEATKTPLEWLSADPVDPAVLYAEHHGIFTMNAVTGEVTLNINGVDYPQPPVTAFGQFAATPADHMQWMICGWHGTYISVGPIDGDPIGVLDATAAAEGQTDFAGFTNPGRAKVIAAPATARIMASNSQSYVLPAGTIKVATDAAKTFAFRCRSHTTTSNQSVAFGSGGPLNGGTTGWVVQSDFGASTGGAIRCALFVTDGTLGGNPATFPLVGTPDPLPDAECVIVARIDHRTGTDRAALFVDGTKIGDVDISALGDIGSSDDEGYLLAGDWEWVAAYDRALTDDEIAFISATPEPIDLDAVPTFGELLSEPSGLTESAVQALIDTAVANLLAGAPGALDTLNELAAALGDDANFAASVATSLAGKQASSAVLTTLAGNGTPGTTGLALLLTTDAAAARSTLGQSWQTIADVTLSGGISTYDVNLTGYRAFRFRFRGASTTTSTSASLRLRFNADTGNNYSSNTTVSTSLILGNVPGQNTNTDRVRLMFGDFALSDGTMWTVGESRAAGANTSTDTSTAAPNPVNCGYLVDAAVTSMTLFLSSGNFTETSRLIVEALA
jgi:hypothetical protein